MRSSWIVFWGALGALAMACGYSTTSRTAKDIRTIYVPFFENKTSEPNLEISVTERVIQNLVTDNTTALRADAKRSAEILGRIPAGRWGEPADLAGTAVFFCSRASDFVTGTALPVDGGYSSSIF